MVLTQVDGSGGAPAAGKPLRQQSFDPHNSLCTFEHGRLIEENGRRLRLFDVEARSINFPLAADVPFKA